MLTLVRDDEPIHFGEYKVRIPIRRVHYFFGYYASSGCLNLPLVCPIFTRRKGLSDIRDRRPSEQLGPKGQIESVDGIT